MKAKHLSENQIQRYVLDAPECDPADSRHITGCELCRAKAANYRLLFSAIQELEEPIFAFNVESLVMTKIEPVVKSPGWSKMLVAAVALLAAAAIGFTGWLNAGQMESIFKGLSFSLLGLAAAVILPVLLFQLWLLQKKQHSRLHLLENY